MGERWRRLVLPAFPVGVVVAVDPVGWSPFGPLRWAVVSTLGLAVVTTFVARIRRPRGALLVVGSAFLGWLLMSTIFGLDRWPAWIGTAERHLGLATWLLFALLFLAGRAMDTDDQRALVDGCVVAALLLGAYVLWEKTVGGPISVTSAGSTARALGPFGSAAFLGAACCVFAPVCVGAALAWRGWRRVAAAVGTVSALGSAVASGTRGAMLALAVTLVVVVIGRRRVPRVALVGLVLVGVALAGSQSFDRAGKGTSRTDEWRIGLRAVKQHPILGAGPEGYRLVFPHVVDDGYVRRYGHEEITDRAHSAPLDVAIVVGIPGALLYLALLALVAQRCWRRLREGEPIAAGVAAAAVAYGLQSLVLFPLAELDLLWWLLIGSLFAPDRAFPPPAVRAADQTSDGSSDQTPDPPADQSLDRLAGRSAEAVTTTRSRQSVTALVALATIVAATGGVLEVAADRAAKRALSARSSLDPVAAERAAEQMVRARPDSVRVQVIAARAWETSDEPGPLREAQRRLDAAARLSPLDPAIVEERARVALHLAVRTGTPTGLTNARAAADALVAADPHNPRAWVTLADVARRQQDAATVAKATKRASELQRSP